MYILRKLLLFNSEVNIIFGLSTHWPCHLHVDIGSCKLHAINHQKGISRACETSATFSNFMTLCIQLRAVTWPCRRFKRVYGVKHIKVPIKNAVTAIATLANVVSLVCSQVTVEVFIYAVDIVVPIDLLAGEKKLKAPTSLATNLI